MAPTPVSVNGVLRLTLTISSQERNIDFWVQRSTVTDTEILSYAGSAFDATGDVVGQVIWDLLRPFYPSGVSAPTWTLFEYDTGALIPLDGGALTDAGSGTGSVSLAWVSTLTFRNGNQVLDRLQIPETIDGTLIDEPLGSSTDPKVVALRDSYTDIPDGTNISTWVTGRDGGVIWRAIGYSRAPNRVLRRARGV